MVKKTLAYCLSSPPGCGIQEGRYRYTEDLLALERVSVGTRPRGSNPVPASESMEGSCRWTIGSHSYGPTQTKPSPSSCREDCLRASASVLTLIAVLNKHQITSSQSGTTRLQWIYTLLTRWKKVASQHARVPSFAGTQLE